MILIKIYEFLYESKFLASAQFATLVRLEKYAGMGL